MGYRDFYCACGFCRFSGFRCFGERGFEEPHNHSRLYHGTLIKADFYPWVPAAAGA
jgi:hypothetical protein